MATAEGGRVRQTMNDSQATMPPSSEDELTPQANTSGLNELSAAVELGVQASAIEHSQLASTPEPAAGSRKKVKARRLLSTEDQYRYRVGLLWRQATDARTTDPQQPPLIKPTDVVDYLIERSRSLRPATWGIYRSALLFCFGELAGSDKNYAEAHDRLSQSRHPTGPRGRRSNSGDPETPPLRTTRSGKTGILKNDLTMLLDQLGLQNRTAGWGARAQYWLLATLATGVRPNEWEEASWGDQEKTWLLAPNSKRKIDVPAFNRADAEHGEAEDDQQEEGVEGEAAAKTFRAIPVGSDSRVFVDLHLSSLNGSGVAFQAYYNNCRTAIWSACKKIWKGKKSYSLYSARHQYSANSKAAYPIGDVAELMGQTDEKSPMFYAPRRLAYEGSGGLRPQHADGQEEAQRADSRGLNNAADNRTQGQGSSRGAN